MRERVGEPALGSYLHSRVTYYWSRNSSKDTHKYWLPVALLPVLVQRDKYSASSPPEYSAHSRNKSVLGILHGNIKVFGFVE